MGAQQPSLLSGLIPILFVFAIFYLMLFLPMRRRQKKHAELLSKLCSGASPQPLASMWTASASAARPVPGSPVISSGARLLASSGRVSSTARMDGVRVTKMRLP